jgi:hypothetical protein
MEKSENRFYKVFSLNSPPSLRRRKREHIFWGTEGHSRGIQKTNWRAECGQRLTNWTPLS